MEKGKVLLILALSVVWMVVSSTSAFAAYSAHQNDKDINNFLAVYRLPSPLSSTTARSAIKGGASPQAQEQVTMVVAIIATGFTIQTQRLKISLRR